MNSLYDAVVSADGRSVTAPVQVPADPASTGGLVTLASAVFAAGDFQALVVGCGFDAPCLRVVSIASDGSVSGAFQVPGPGPAAVPAFNPLLVPGADDVRLLYGTDCANPPGNVCLMAERLSAAGAVVSPATQVDSIYRSGLGGRAGCGDLLGLLAGQVVDPGAPFVARHRRGQYSDRKGKSGCSHVGAPRLRARRRFLRQRSFSARGCAVGALGRLTSRALVDGQRDHAGCSGERGARGE